MAQKKKTILKILGVAAPLAGLFFAHGVLAASLYLSPASGNYLTGHTFTVGVFVSSADQAMNAAQGTLSFPINKLTVLSVSKTNSVMNLWVQDPSFSNQDGTVNFGGVVVNPGFEGAGGRIVTITFQVKNAGDAPVNFTAGSVLANDGLGTNILTGMQGADFTLAQAPPGTTSISASTGGTVSHPAIVSTPALLNGTWYNLNSILFSWNVPSDVTAVSYAMSADPDYQLPTTPEPVVSQASYDLTTFADGPWYFFLSFEEGGVWSVPAVQELQLDRTPPEPFVITQEGLGMNDDQPVFKWAAVDKTSGIAYYEVKIGDGDWFNAQTIQQGSSYVLPVQAPGNGRTLTVRAYDEAGNFEGSSINFDVPSTTGLQGWFSALQNALGAWEWLILIVIACLALASYLFIYHLFTWKKQMRRELQKLSSQLGHDLHDFEDDLEEVHKKGMRVDLRPSHFDETRKTLEKGVKQIEEDVKEEVKRLDKLTDDK